MKTNQLATLVLRLLGIYCIIQVVPTVTILSSMAIAAKIAEHSDFPIAMAFVQASISSICWLMVAILLFVFSAPWGERLAKGINMEKITGISFEQVQVLAFAVVGALLIAEGLSQFCGSIYSISISVDHLNRNQNPMGPQFIDWHSLLSAFGFILKTLIGAWMFFGTNGFANFWRSAQNFATPNPPEN